MAGCRRHACVEMEGVSLAGKETRQSDWDVWVLWVSDDNLWAWPLTSWQWGYVYQLLSCSELIGVKRLFQVCIKQVVKNWYLWGFRSRQPSCDSSWMFVVVVLGCWLTLEFWGYHTVLKSRFLDSSALCWTYSMDWRLKSSQEFLSGETWKCAVDAPDDTL